MDPCQVCLVEKQCRIFFKNMAQSASKTRFESFLYHQPAVWPWGSYLAFLCLSFLFYTLGMMMMMIAPASGLFRRRQWHPTPVLLPGKSYGRRSLVGCHLWGRTESDTTERLHFHFSLSCIGEGNGNPLQYSCLENPRDEGAWWAVIYGVAQSWP